MAEWQIPKSLDDNEIIRLVFSLYPDRESLSEEITRKARNALEGKKEHGRVNISNHGGVITVVIHSKNPKFTQDELKKIDGVSYIHWLEEG
jgi:hypothetical protein